MQAQALRGLDLKSVIDLEVSILYSHSCFFKMQFLAHLAVGQDQIYFFPYLGFEKMVPSWSEQRQKVYHEVPRYIPIYQSFLQTPQTRVHTASTRHAYIFIGLFVEQTLHLVHWRYRHPQVITKGPQLDCSHGKGSPSNAFDSTNLPLAIHQY